MAPVSPRASAFCAGVESSLAGYGLAACSDIRTPGGIGSVRRECEKLQRQRFSPDILAPSIPGRVRHGTRESLDPLSVAAAAFLKANGLG